MQLVMRASKHQEARMNACYRVELSQSDRAELMQLLSARKQAARKPAAQPSLRALS